MTLVRSAVGLVRGSADGTPWAPLRKLAALVFFYCGLAGIFLPGPAALADDFPDGCVSCHVVLPDGADKRLAAVLDEIGHLALKDKVARAPADCIACHEKKSDTKFSVLIHQAHFGSPDKNIFIERFGGDCRHCHAVDGGTGEAALKQGDANW